MKKISTSLGTCGFACGQIASAETSVRLKLSQMLLAGTLLISATSTQAANALLEFSDSLKTFSASFTQTVYDADSVVLQESTGVVVLARPGRFRWTYDAPISQVIVADGLTLWVYDEEIKQVTKQPQSTTLGSAPIGLLSGQLDIESEFVVTELGQKDDLEWFQLQPLVSDTDFNEIFIALNADGLSAMELRDNFDQATQIVFSNFAQNIAVDSEQFNFVVPDGVDVVGEGGVEQEQDELLQEESDVPQSGQTPPPAQIPAETATDPLLVEGDAPSIGDTDVPAAGAISAPSLLAPAANTDENLLGDELPNVEDSVQTSDDLTETPDDDVPLVTEEQTPPQSTSDPSREITFEEQKVSE